MKNKSIFILSVFILSLVSCKKSYTCSCTTVTTVKDAKYPSVIVNQAETKPYSDKMKEKQARAACEHEAETIKSTYNNAFTGNGSRENFADVSVNCELN